MKHARIVAAAAAVLALNAVPAAAQEWSGPYFGLTIGAGEVDDADGERTEFDTNLDGTFDDTVRTGAGADAFSSSLTTPAGFCGGAPVANNFAAGCLDDDSETDFSFRGGYDWRSGSLVYGVVGELSKVTASDAVTAFSTTPASYTFERDVDALLALRGRLGFAIGRFLPYATAGVAYGEVENTFRTSNGANSFTPSRASSNVTGWQGGAGVEAQVGERLRLGVEYLYTNLEDDDGLTVRVGPGAAPPTNPFLLVNAQGTDMRRSETDFKLQQLRFTASFAF